MIKHSGAYFSATASSPGIGDPSNMAKLAPPPVETWLTRSATPSNSAAAAVSPPPTMPVAAPSEREPRLHPPPPSQYGMPPTQRRPWGHSTRWSWLRPAHQRRLGRFRADIKTHQAIRNISGHDGGLGVFAEFSGNHMIGGQEHRRTG